jgi:hypothetical protein
MRPVTSLGDGYQILEDGTLRIDQVRIEDEGTYTCFAGNFVGPMDTATAYLKVIGRLFTTLSTPSHMLYGYFPDCL